MPKAVQEGIPVWEPSVQWIQESNLTHYMKWLKETRGLDFRHYDELWQWSVSEVESFWASLWEYFEFGTQHDYESVLSTHRMPGAKWFVGAKINYAEFLFRNLKRDHVAIISKSEIRPMEEMTWGQLYDRVASFASALKKHGVQQGDRVVAFMPNLPETIVAFLGCASIGAIWSCCSPDYGSSTVVDRFKQIEPKLLIAVDGYRYGGKEFNRLQTVLEIQEKIPTLEKTILLPYLNENPDLSEMENVELWDEFVNKQECEPLEFQRVDFSHPLWVLYSSGTTGLPKAIVHGQGGILLEHMKAHVLHGNLKEGDRFFWYTTTGWMMWNYVVGALLAKGTIILYDGNPGYPELDFLWGFAEDTGMNVFGTSASYLLNCKKVGLVPKDKFNLERITGIFSTGSPLPPEGFQWVYDNVKSDVWLVSTSGGTDICSALVTGCPLLPVYIGEIQCRALGAKVEAFDDDGNPVMNDVGELVVTEPLPSMPLYFWNDEGNERYKASYFDMYEGVWRHGDWIKIFSRGSCQILGRSDSTINRGGIRIGTSEIYSVVENIEGIAESLVIDLSNELGSNFMPLFVVLKEGVVLDDGLVQKIKQEIREKCSARHVPSDVYEIPEVPKTLNGKKMEVPIKKLFMGIPLEKAVNKDSMSNPESLHYFIQMANQLLNFQG